MKENLKKKITIINDVSNLAENSIAIIIIDYAKLTSLEIKYIRQALFKQNIKAKVLKNTLAKKIFQNTNYNLLNNYMIGQTMIIFSKNEISSPIKILNDLKRKYTNIKIKSICIYNRLFFEKNIKELIELPSKELALYKFVTCLKLPLIQVINNLNYPCTKLLTLLKLTENQKRGI